MRPRSTSARASGRAMSARMAPAATSSSAKNALPSERARIRSTTAGGTGWPATAWRCSASSTRPKGESRSAPGRGGGPARPAAAAGMAAVQLVGAVAGHQGDPAAARGPDQEGQQVAGGAVGPVEVLDHQQQRGQLGQADQQRQHPVEQLDPLEAVPGRGRRPVVGGQLGQQPAEAGTAAPAGPPPRPRPGGAEVAEGVDEGHVGEADVADLHAAADQHPDAAAWARRRRPAAGSCRRRRRRRSARRPAARVGPVEQGDQAVELFGPATKLPAVVEVTPESMAFPPTTRRRPSHLRPGRPA